MLYRQFKPKIHLGICNVSDVENTLLDHTGVGASDTNLSHNTD